MMWSFAATAQKTQIALLKYRGGGDWYSNPTSLPNLVKFCNHNIMTDINVDVATVDVGSPDIFNYPFVHATGHGNIVFDDNEVDNLRKVCDEVFGGANFIAHIIHKNNSMKNQSKYIGVSTEYILIYAKDIIILNEKQGAWRTKKKGASEINAMFKKLKDNGLSITEIHSEIDNTIQEPIIKPKKEEENSVNSSYFILSTNLCVRLCGFS